MDALEVFNSAKDSLVSNRLRSTLTVLGIIIGVAAVILLVSLGEGARAYIKRQLGDLGSNILIVVPGKTAKEGGMQMGTSTVRKLRMSDAALIEKRARYVEHAVPIIIGTSWIKYGNKSRNTYVVGVTGPYFHVRNLKMAAGRAISDDDVSAARRVCVLGRTVKRELMGAYGPLGGSVTIGNARFRPVGEMAPKGVALGFDLDDVVFIPVTSAVELFDTDWLFNITVKVASEDKIPIVKKEIRRLLMKRHAGKEDFTILSQDEMISVMSRILRIMTAVLSGIAAISLVVGGIGIMNIMLVSVSERTREIGIRKAVGATNRDILVQFLAESVALSLAGGLAGVAVGVAIGLGFSYFTSAVPVKIAWWSVGLAFFFSAAVGVFFGVYPAAKAAAFDPIIALRHE
ncbi:MAG: ABC transporter permease [Actinomycetota bacterium]|nr:ABC transporter permease [Actinomycetota bacterium]